MVMSQSLLKTTHSAISYRTFGCFHKTHHDFTNFAIPSSATAKPSMAIAKTASRRRRASATTMKRLTASSHRGHRCFAGAIDDLPGPSTFYNCKGRRCFTSVTSPRSNMLHDIFIKWTAFSRKSYSHHQLRTLIVKLTGIYWKCRYFYRIHSNPLDFPTILCSRRESVIFVATACDSRFFTEFTGIC